MKSYPVVIIGAGPAGMAAAKILLEQKINCLILDEQSAPGGQIYRGIDRNMGDNPGRVDLLGKEYEYGSELTKNLINNDYITTMYNAKIWRIENTGSVYFSLDQQAQKVDAEIIILANGAQERPFAFPGWTLPGVMTAGAAQIMLKAHGLVVENAVLAGNGPLLYLIASQLINAGSPPKAILETAAPNAWKKSLPLFPKALFDGWSYLWKGTKMLAAIKKAGIPHYRNIANIKAEGEDKIDSVLFDYKGKSKQIPTSNLLIHQGVIPNVQMSRSLNIKHIWNKQQQSWQPEVNEWNVSSQKNILIAGDGGGIGGAICAELSGEIAAIEAAFQLKKIPQSEREKMSAPLRNRFKKERAIRLFLDTLYTPDFNAMLQSDDTLICRCEEVTAGDLRGYARAGCLGLNQTKAFSRCGMGPCQGRQCGNNAAMIIADELKIPMEKVEYYRIRAPIKPVSLNEIASLQTES